MPDDSIQTEQQLYAAFEALSTEGGWHRELPALWAAPRRNFSPYLWRYDAIKPLLDAAGRLVSTELAERRNLTLRNPVDGNPYATVNTLVAAYQMIRPGEVAKSHRHTPNALRLIMEGQGTYTVVNGKRVEMRPGDVLLTPSWSWHSHESTGTEDCYWMDFLDVPLVQLLEPMFFERHPLALEPDPVDTEDSPIVFRWQDTLTQLSRRAYRETPYADYHVELGQPALETIGLAMLKFNSCSCSERFQTTSNGIFAVVEGAGWTEVDGKRFDWSRGDTIAVPSWRPYQHFCREDAVLLWVNDSPLMHKLQWYKARRLGYALQT